jgi:hypothetical protein
MWSKRQHLSFFDYDVCPQRAGADSPARRTFSEAEQQKIADTIVKNLNNRIGILSKAGGRGA